MGGRNFAILGYNHGYPYFLSPPRLRPWLVLSMAGTNQCSGALAAGRLAGKVQDWTDAKRVGSRSPQAVRNVGSPHKQISSRPHAHPATPHSMAQARVTTCGEHFVPTREQATHTSAQAKRYMSDSSRDRSRNTSKISYAHTPSHTAELCVVTLRGYKMHH